VIKVAWLLEKTKKFQALASHVGSSFDTASTNGTPQLELK
jgi:hypothetical protein